ncbi:MAG: glycosyltransferase [Nitrospira sp.]|jgi:glycosyltransferase involved in cell wall biosynthesis|nr:glycosyltransferase [Nitrospira sp.]
MKRVYIQQNFIAHYRKAVFELLSSSKEFEFTFLADSKADTPSIKVAEWETSRIRRQYAKTSILKLPLIPALFWQPRVIALVARDKPDLVIAVGNPYSLTTWAILFLGRLWSIPVLLWGHGLLKWESGPKWWLRKSFYKLARGLLLYGDNAKDLLSKKGFDSRTLKVIYNSLDFQVQKSLMEKIIKRDLDKFRSSIKVSDGEGLIAFSGRLQTNKKIGLLLDSVGVLRTRGRTVHIALIGDGSEKAALISQTIRLGIVSQVHFLGESYEERFIATVFMASDLAVIPSGAGLSVMHALGYGLPVLLHDRPEEHGPEWEAIREGETGFFYRYGDVIDMAEKIESALFSRSRTAMMKDACLAMIRDRYNASAHANAITAAVSQAIESRR